MGGMMKKVLISVVEDDRFLRESMCRLMRSLGYTVDMFSSAADFLASPRLFETACLIADIHMPAMTGLELYRRLVDTGNAIPTILVTAFPNDADRARALNDGVLCYLRKPVDEEQRYFEVTPAQRWQMGAMYFGLIALLVFAMDVSHEQLNHIHRQPAQVAVVR